MRSFIKYIRMFFRQSIFFCFFSFLAISEKDFLRGSNVYKSMIDPSFYECCFPFYKYENFISQARKYRLRFQGAKSWTDQSLFDFDQQEKSDSLCFLEKTQTFTDLLGSTLPVAVEYIKKYKGSKSDGSVSPIQMDEICKSCLLPSFNINICHYGDDEMEPEYPYLLQGIMNAKSLNELDKYLHIRAIKINKSYFLIKIGSKKNSAIVNINFIPLSWDKSLTSVLEMTNEQLQKISEASKEVITKLNLEKYNKHFSTDFFGLGWKILFVYNPFFDENCPITSIFLDRAFNSLNEKMNSFMTLDQLPNEIFQNLQWVLDDEEVERLRRKAQKFSCVPNKSHVIQQMFGIAAEYEKKYKQKHAKAIDAIEDKLKLNKEFLNAHNELDKDKLTKMFELRYDINELLFSQFQEILEKNDFEHFGSDRDKLTLNEKSELEAKLDDIIKKAIEDDSYKKIHLPTLLASSGSYSSIKSKNNAAFDGTNVNEGGILDVVNKNPGKIQDVDRSSDQKIQKKDKNINKLPGEKEKKQNSRTNSSTIWNFMEIINYVLFLPIIFINFIWNKIFIALNFF